MKPLGVMEYWNGGVIVRTPPLNIEPLKFRTDDKEILEESYDTTIRTNFAIPPHPSMAGVASLIQELEKLNPKAKGAKPEEFADGRLVREIEQSGFLKSLQ